MTKVLRRYQERSLENFIKWSNSDSKLATLILATGTGKTFTIASCLEHIPNKKILWVAHRKELIYQAFKTIKETVSWTQNISIELGKQKADANSDIIVGSVQTLYRPRKHISDFIPDYIIIDEYHHMSETNKTYQSLVSKYPNAKIVGMTATAFRFSGDDLPLGEVLFELDIGSAIKHNYLVPVTAEILKSNVSLANVKTQMGDFAVAELSKAINVQDRNELIINRVVELVAEGRQGVVFGADVGHSKALAALAKARGLTVAEIYGDTPEEERDSIVEKIGRQEIDCTFNNLVCTEGTDVPHWSFAVIARPTRSLGLYIQCAGRILRTFPNKSNAIIVDVYDKLKVKQSRVTFKDMVTYGDIFGDAKRANNILNALMDLKDLELGDKQAKTNDHIAMALKNFPIFVCDGEDGRWTVDDDFIPITSWSISEDQKLITWTEESLVNKINEDTTWTPLKVKPTLSVVKERPIKVKHAIYGEGVIIDVGLGTELKVRFDNGWTSLDNFVNYQDLQIKGILKSYAQEVDKIKVDKLFYLCFPPLAETGRLVEMERVKKELVVLKDERMKKSEAKNYLLDCAMKRGIFHLVRSDAKWKKSPISNSQRELIENLIRTKKIRFDLDLDSLTKGDASAIIEQVRWQKIINEKFGTDKKEKLVGYDEKTSDI